MSALLKETFKVKTYEIQFITPTSLVGANQDQCELRGASFRGALRWWFRLLGGKPSEERAIFGGLGTPPTASKIIVRCKAKPEHLKSDDPIKGDGVGARGKTGAYYAAGSKITLEIIERQPLIDTQRAQLNEAIEAMIHFGSIGYRATRTYGAMALVHEEKSGISYEALVDWCQRLEKKKIYVRTLSTEHIADWKMSRDRLDEFLKDIRKTFSAKQNTALGSVNPRRTSALRLRPILLDIGSYLPAVIYSDNACDATSLWDQLESNPWLKRIEEIK